MYTKLKTNSGNVILVKDYIGKAAIGEILKRLSAISFQLSARIY
jgi:hypothetical protein